MRATILLTTLLAIGCGGDDKNSGPMDMAVSNVSTDMQPDMEAAAMCDLIAQDCPTGMKCATVNGMMAVTTMCVMAGTATDGQPCTRTMGMDNCAAGFSCARGAGVCRKLCTGDTGCDTGQKCSTLSRAVTTVGVCAPACTPFGTDCGALNCSATATTLTGMTSFFTCRTPGMTADFDTCNAGNSCAADRICDPTQQWCTPLCDTGSNPANSCPAFATDGGVALSCQRFTSGPSGIGFCGQ